MMMLLQLCRRTTIRSHNNAIAAAVCFRNISTTTAASSSVQVPKKMKTSVVSVILRVLTVTEQITPS
jgi:hypothetical protein